MSTDDFQRIASFRASFARRQAAESHEVPGGVLVLDPAFPVSWDNNQLVIHEPAEPADLLKFADAGLAALAHRQITVLDDALGDEVAPALAAAGYEHSTELVMTHYGPVSRVPSHALEISLDELLPAVYRLLKAWMPESDEDTVRQFAERRAARRNGADEVLFLADRGEDGAVAAWADYYRDNEHGIAQMEDLSTADDRLRRGHADAVLTASLQRAAQSDLFFLLADADDWPHEWYSRRGFTTIGRFHRFSRTCD